MAMTQLQSYAFTTVEASLSDGGKFQTITGFVAPNVPSGGTCEPSATGGAGSASFWSGAVVQTGDSWPNDQYSEVTIKTLNTGAITFPSLRISSIATTFYHANLSPIVANQGLFKHVNGVQTQIGSNFSATIALNDVWRLSVTGTTLTISQNGSTVFTGTDSSIVSGSPGFGLFATTAITDDQISLWAAGGNQAVAPTFSPVAGSYATAQNVIISSTTPGGLIYYTTNGSTPTHSSSTTTNGGVVRVSSAQTIKAFASASNFADSTTVSAVYSGALLPTSSWLQANRDFINKRGIRGN